ncbi:helix-turn-helix domain-containing protein [Neobacillus vireti]|uniref:Helix-turn-helix domain-containing protein n=1 Tax=Neobacillus vireti LMG 21834 TaxID=1131730 RepID=A0AB94IKY9_9BACI|nr:helix-turn-helix domain-containing protein [Neobacillus vireti]ETI67741.1 hypothetical protein BAVI_15867 [Neobacillus vireti LMG 21834]KLT17286.1 hypothetical protein AA980_15525 [Neobacillus vireti]
MSFKEVIQEMSWKEFEKVAHQYPIKVPRIFELVDDDTLLTTEDIEELVVVTRETVRNWIRTGALRVHSPVGVYRVNGDDFKEFLFERFKNEFLKDI